MNDDMKNSNFLADSIDYQDGSIVSKTLINKKVGTITLFAFDESQALSTHSDPYDAFLNVVDGEASIVISEKEYIVKAGQFIIMPANEPHSVTANTKMKMMLVMIKEK